METKSTKQTTTDAGEDAGVGKNLHLLLMASETGTATLENSSELSTAK